MRIAISGVACTVTLLASIAASAQGDKPEPVPVLPRFPPAAPPAPSVTSAAPDTTPPNAPAAKDEKPAPPGKKPAAAAKKPTVPKRPVVVPRNRRRPTRDPNAPSTPPPGLAPPPPAPVAQPVFKTDSSAEAIKEPPLAGWHDGFFLRDPGDHFRFYPRGRFHLDFHTFPGAPTGTADEGGVQMQPRFFARRLRLEFAGEAFKRWTFTFGVDFSQPVSNTDAHTATLNGTPDSVSMRFSSVESVGPSANIANVFINYSFCPCLNVMIGQHQAPFSLEHRTSNNSNTFMERHLPIRSFVAPNAKELGLTLWGDLFDDRLSYEVGVYAGDGQNRPQIDGQPDFIGRVFTRPLHGSKGLFDGLQLGVSARTGQRDQNFVGYDYQPVTTAQGWSLWEPRYKDSQGRRIHVIPSGEQLQIGGELRLPLSIFELRGEAYYVSNNTREAVEGYQLTNTERLGTMTGVGWYVQASVWPLGDSFVNGNPGYSRPMTLNLTSEPSRVKRGFELAAVIGGVNAEYLGGSRGGDLDANTPSAAAGSKINVFEYGFGINYWYTRYIRASVNYMLYHTPGSSSPENLAVVPGNELGPNASPEAHLHHELGTRIGIGF